MKGYAHKTQQTIKILKVTRTKRNKQLIIARDDDDENN